MKPHAAAVWRDRPRVVAAAYHEAGHAVAALEHGHRLVRATVVPNEDEGYVGRVTSPGLPPGMLRSVLGWWPSTAVRVRAEEVLLVTAAGGHAPAAFLGVGADDPRGVDSRAMDDLQNFDLAVGLEQDDEGRAHALLQLVELRAAAFVPDELNWVLIEGVAMALSPGAF
ncbi:MAG: hypothetical protein R3C15_07220 [Thermoleophilia bacterium]